MNAIFRWRGVQALVRNLNGLGLAGRGCAAGFHGSQILETEVKGQVAAKVPTKVICESGKTYSWCACGLSNRQPFCDGSHKRSALGLTPLRWTCNASKEYFFCNCKQTNNRPLCDGSHKKL